MAFCTQCGAAMSGDEVGLHKKIVNRGAVEFRCPVCLSAHFKIPVEELRHMIERFRKQGCTLFAPQAEKEGNRDAG